MSFLWVLALSGCTQPSNQAPVVLKGDKFYGFDETTNGESTHYVVQPGDSLSVLAKRYHVSVSAIASANRLAPPYIIKIGQKLHIPANAPTLTKGKMLAKLDPNTHQSVPVDTITSNNVAPPLKEEQKITIVRKEELTAKATPSPAPTSNTNATPMSLIPPVPAVKLDAPFIWPLKGPVLLHFGPGKGGYFNDGINISAPENTPIAASAGGKIVYAGNELRGYGNLIIIRHDNGWLTAYAHQKEMVVKKGDNVTKGQTIGYVGATGNVTAPQLHFGIRNGKNALNPEEYLPKG